MQLDLADVQCQWSSFLDAWTGFMCFFRLLADLNDLFSYSFKLAHFNFFVNSILHFFFKDKHPSKFEEKVLIRTR